MKVPFLDLNIQYQQIKTEIDKAISDVIKRTDFVAGYSVNQFENNFARYTGVKHCIGVNNGTNALFLILNALGIGAGDEVIIPANTFVATAEAIVYTGAKPVMVDIDSSSKLIDLNKIQNALSKKTKAIIAVHLYGRMADMIGLEKIAKQNSLYLIEDAAQAHGAVQENRKAGSIGIAGAFSFYPGKNLGAYGDAGAVTTSDEELARKLYKLRDHGSDKKHYHDTVGYNARLNGMMAAILDVKLIYLDLWNDKRNEVAASYQELLELYPIQLPELLKEEKQVFHIYAIEVEKRDKLQLFLSEKNVSTNIHYPIPIHIQKGYEFLGYKTGDFPVTEDVAQKLLSLPMYPELTRDQIEYVSARIGEFLDYTDPV